MTGRGMELPGGSGRTPLGSSNSYLGTSVVGATSGTDIHRVGGMDLSLSSGSGVLEVVNALPAENSHLGVFGDDCSVNDNQNMSTSFDWASTDIDGWPDMEPDYLQANLSY